MEITEKKLPIKEQMLLLIYSLILYFFKRFGLPEGKFTLFKRLEDYYRDAKFSAEELETLIDEVNQIKTLFSENKGLTLQLNQLLVVFEKGFKEQKSIWVFCD
ncbi:hypothetical protein [uncultured Cocleimonas sp.]|uniref:hypothetical protein n=1 Tax=uncultured Cocleimonas sp. TaxID=1051587 RepID=UPI002635E72E|nr:hypothetical protein [uncultured Cocleimonas sp.]